MPLQPLLKRTLMGLAGLLVMTAGGLAYLTLRSPEAAPPPDIRVPMTPERIARGKFLFEVVADCDGCHSMRDWTRFGGPVLKHGAGWAFPPELGLPGAVVAPNITPNKETGIGEWTDGEKIRAIREGVSRDGRALFPMMPYQSFRNMSDSDVQSLVAYMNTLTPVKNPLPRTELAFPVNLMIKSAPKPVSGAVGEPQDLGKYLVTLGGCAECHSRKEKGAPVEGMEFAGGEIFRLGGYTVVTPNITPDLETGLGKWTDEQFIKRFHDYRDYAKNGPPLVKADSFTLMPWLAFSEYSEDELKAIFRYLKTLKPVTNLVEVHPGS